jgi:hypothetical protein
MAWHFNLGIDERIMQKTDANDQTRQKFIFSMLVIMLIIVSGLIFVSAVAYMLIIVNNWWLAAASGLLISLIVYNLYRLLLVTAINAEKTFLGRYQLNHELHYIDLFDNRRFKEFEEMPDEQILKIVNARKEKLRDNSSLILNKPSGFIRLFFTNLMRVFILFVIAVVFSTGLQLLIFKDQINEVLNATSLILNQNLPDSWLLKNILTTEDGSEFILINCNSLLLAIQLLVKGLGFWKLVLDILFLTLVLLPLILILKSKEIQNGSYIKELALHEVSISFFHYLKTQKYCAFLLRQNLATEINTKANRE